MKVLFKRLFAGADQHAPVDESRRRFLKGAAGLAAVAVVATAPGGVRLLTADENQAFQEAVRSGLVENQTFYLDRTAVLQDLKNVVIRNCRFIAVEGFEGNILIEFKNCEGLVLNGCHLDAYNITEGADMHISTEAQGEMIHGLTKRLTEHPL